MCIPVTDREENSGSLSEGVMPSHDVEKKCSLIARFTTGDKEDYAEKVSVLWVIFIRLE